MSENSYGSALLPMLLTVDKIYDLERMVKKTTMVAFITYQINKYYKFFLNNKLSADKSH